MNKLLFVEALIDLTSMDRERANAFWETLTDRQKKLPLEAAKHVVNQIERIKKL